MALLGAGSLKKSFGVNTILDNLSFEIQDNDKIGLVGVNGCGKTTLFKILTGELPYDGGDLYTSKNTVIGYMEQHVVSEKNITAYEEVLSVFKPLMDMENELEDLLKKLTQNPADTERLIERQAYLTEHYAAEGGLTYKSRTKSVLMGLGFDENGQQQKAGVLSGGQKAKLQLARMLLSGANLLLLDEPTNHLDIAAVEWLEDFLKNYNGAFIVISHDRYFLDRITSRTFELENKRLTCYKGNYTTYLKLKDEDRVARQRQYENTKREITRIEGIVAQQRQWNRERNIRTAESKLKAIEKLESTLDKPDANPDSIRFSFGMSTRSGNDVLDVQNLSLSFKDKPLFSDVNMEIHRGERIFLIGPNGCGKTSLFKTLLGIYKETGGMVKFGTGVEIGYYDQVQEGLHPEKTVLDEIWDSYPQMTQTEIRNALAVFLFTADDVYKQVALLSGGEKARVLLLRLMLSKANFLLLDEPTNHLDIASREALEQALLAYEGTLLIVSHDRYLINKLSDRIYTLDAAGTEEYRGNYDYYLERRVVIESAAPIKEKPKADAYRLKKERESEVRKQKSRLKRSEQEIEQLEAENQQLENKLLEPDTAADYEAAMKITNEIDLNNGKLNELYELWASLTEELSEEA